jgi:hypothetical protein
VPTGNKAPVVMVAEFDSGMRRPSMGHLAAMNRRRLREALGVLACDLPNLVWRVQLSRLRGGHARPWVRVRNRRERLTPGPDSRGVRCDWLWTSELRATRVFPWTGTLLLRTACRDWPLRLTDTPVGAPRLPGLSFILGHRGGDRVELLRATVASITAQVEASVDCVIVNQSSRSLRQEFLPKWVTIVDAPPAKSTMPYSRSWAFNLGATRARAAALAFHDGDLLVPASYAAQALARVAEGYEVLNLKRFIFYLSEGASSRLVSARCLGFGEPPTAVLQNAEAGGSIVVTRAAFEAIGGFDESFVGWGGEDNEFWERCQTRRVYPWGYLPMIHLWHPPQLGRRLGPASPMLGLYQKLSRIPVEERVRELKSRPQGLLSGPVPEWVPPRD